MADLDPLEEQGIAPAWALRYDSHLRQILAFRLAKERGLSQPTLKEIQEAGAAFARLVAPSEAADAD